MASEAAASQPMKPEPTTAAVRAPSARSRSVRARLERAQEQHAGWSAPGTGRATGSAPVASTQAS